MRRSFYLLTWDFKCVLDKGICLGCLNGSEPTHWTNQRSAVSVNDVNFQQTLQRETHSDTLRKQQNRFSPRSVPDPVRKAYDASPDHLVGWDRGYPPHSSPPRRLKPSSSSASSAPRSRPPKLIGCLRAWYYRRIYAGQRVTVDDLVALDKRTRLFRSIAITVFVSLDCWQRPVVTNLRMIRRRDLLSYPFIRQKPPGTPRLDIKNVTKWWQNTCHCPFRWPYLGGKMLATAL